MSTENESKVTANVDSDVYNTVAQQFHYGQRTLFFQKLFKALKDLADQDKWHEVTDFMYNDANLTLPGKEE
jgi:hypothetical protein